jgi:LAO/AO transport system kinase
MSVGSATHGGANQELLAGFRAGQRYALARAISLVENMRPGFESLLHDLYGDIGGSHRVGITGPPGAGKSTLTSQLTLVYRGRGESVGIVAVDPSSPFTGGALLGDRIRMANVSTDPGVFIRSMAARGSLGGLAMTTREVADVMDAFGFEQILTETVGVGQSEMEITQAADSVVVVLVPESGDSIQAMKAGLMEIADIFVVNKADRPGADRLVQELELMLHMRLGEAIGGAGHHGAGALGAGPRARARAKERAADEGSWSIPVLKTVAQSGEGVEALVETLDRHSVYLRESGELRARREKRVVERVRGLVERELRRQVWDRRGGWDLLQQALPDLAAGGESPYTLASRIVSAVVPAWGNAAEVPEVSPHDRASGKTGG